MNYRLLQLQEDLKKKDACKTSIFDAAMGLKADLNRWMQSLRLENEYVVVQKRYSYEDMTFNGACHVYNSPWIAQLWNSWRTITVQVNQVILQSKYHDIKAATEAGETIRQISVDICLSVSSFSMSPRRLPLSP